MDQVKDLSEFLIAVLDLFLIDRQEPKFIKEKVLCNVVRRPLCDSRFRPLRQLVTLLIQNIDKFKLY